MHVLGPASDIDPWRTWVRKATVLRTTAVAAVAIAGLAACSNGSSNSSSGLGSGSSSGNASSNQTYKIGFQGALSGDNQQLGINEINAMELAVKEANDGGKLPFKLEVVRSDDGGTADKAPAAASALLQDNAIVGVVGPIFSGPTKAVGTTYAQAGMALISPSATNPTLTSSGFTTFHRIVPTDSVEGVEAADWLAAKFKKVFVIDDTSEYGKGAADVVRQELKTKGITSTDQSVPASTQDYGAVAQAVVSSGAEAMFYGGYDAQAALLAKALQSAGYKGLAMAGNGGKSSVFTQNSGAAGDGWYFSCGCLDATVAPQAKDFTAAYKKAYNTDPSTYSPEAFDATNAMIDAIKTAQSSGKVTRATVEDAVSKLNYKGITTTIKFQSNGEVEQQVINLYQQKSGVIALVGDIKKQS
jgi:branched-chain amino acid transport system substrate-binding protein